MKGRRNIIKVMAALLALCTIVSCVPFGMAFAADRPSNGGYSNFVDDSYSVTDEKTETVEKTITASKLVYTTSTSATAEFSAYTKALTADTMIVASLVKSYFSVDVYGAYKAYADANPNSVITLKEIRVEQKAQLSGGSSTVNVETGYSINGGMIAEGDVKPLVSAGSPIAVNSSKAPLSSTTVIDAETVLSALTSKDMYLVWYVGQSTKAMYYYAPSVTLVFDVYTKTTTDYNNDTTTANGSNGSFTNGVLDINTTQKLTPETVTGQKIYLGAYNNGYVGSSSYGSSNGQIYTSVTSVKEQAKNPKTNAVLDPAKHQKFSIPYKAPAYLNYDIQPYLDYIEATLVAQGKTNVKITITSVDLYTKVRMGYTGSYASSYAPYDDVAVSVAPSWTGSNYPTSNYQQTGDYYANYAYNVTVYLATSLTAAQVTQLNSTKAMTVRIQSTDYYGYYDYISTLNYLWTLVEDYPTIAINYSYTCDNVEETVVDNSVQTNLYAEHKFYEDDELVMGKTKFIGTLKGVGAKATVAPYTSGTVNNLYTYANGVQSYTNTGSAVVSADQYVLQRAYVDAGDGKVISIDSTSAKSAYTVSLLASTLAQTSDSARVVFEYRKGKTPAAEYECKSFEVKEDGGKLYFTVVTSPADINRIKIFDTTDAGSYVKLISTYTEDANGNYVWTASIAAPSKTTTYGADARANADNKYLKNYAYATYTVPAQGGVSNTTYVKDATYKVEGGKVVFTVTTAPNSVNRVKVSAADATNDYIAYATKHTVDANGNWVWTITIDAPSAATNYAFDARLTSTGKYAKAYFYMSVDPSDTNFDNDTSIFTNATYTVANGKVTFTVTSRKTVDINRVRVAPATAPTEYITYVSKCTTDASGNYVWTLTIDAPSADTAYAFDARLVSTGKYAKAYYYIAVKGDGSGDNGGNSGTVTPAPGATFKNVSASINGDVLTFVITTSPVAISRIKVMNSADMKTNLKLVSDYTVDANGNYVWVVSIDAPKAKTTYAFDARSSETGSYLKDYFYIEIDPATVTVVEPEIKSVSYSVSGEQFVFTVTTTSANINRVKVCDANGKLISYVSQCTRNANGDFEWILTSNIVKGISVYNFYMRDALTGLYIDEGFEYTVDYKGPDVVNPNSPVESVTYTTSGGIVTFKVTTAAGAYNRLKVAYLNDLSTAIAYTDKYVEVDGKYVWTLSVAQVGEDTTYSFDVRSSATNKYIKEYFDFTVPAGEVNDDVDSLVFKSVTSSVVDGKLTFTVETYKGYNRIKVSSAAAPSSYIKYTNAYTETADSQIWTITIDAPEITTAYSFAVRPVDGTSYLKERALYIHTVVDTPKVENWGTINESGVYTAKNGGYQIVLPGWVHYGTVQGADTVAAAYTAPTSCLFAYVYDVVDQSVFDGFTADDFASSLGTTIDTFRKTTIGDGYTCYVITAPGMYVYTFQTSTARYFLNFMQAADGVDVETISNTAMTNIIIYDAAPINAIVY